MEFKLLTIGNNVLIYTIFFVSKSTFWILCCESKKEIYFGMVFLMAFVCFKLFCQYWSILSYVLFFPSDKMKQYRIKYQKSLKPFDIPFFYHPFHSEASTEHDVWESESNINIYTRIKNKDKHEYAAALYWILSNLFNFYLENVDCAHRDRNVYTVPFISHNFNIDVLFCIIAHFQGIKKWKKKMRKK